MTPYLHGLREAYDKEREAFNGQANAVGDITSKLVSWIEEVYHITHRLLSLLPLLSLLSLSPSPCVIFS
jgi:hypothetical protein